MAGTTSSTKNVLHVDKTINNQRYSTKTKLLRATRKSFSISESHQKEVRASSFEFSANELQQAEFIWILCIQSSSFQEEIRCIHNDRHNAKVDELGMFIDDDHIIRCDGRIDEATVPEHARQPLLLSPRHPLTEPIIRESHKMVRRNGIKETLNCVREILDSSRARSSKTNCTKMSHLQKV